MLQVREKEGRPQVKPPKATLSLILLNVVVYVLASGSSSFFTLSGEVLNGLSLQAAKPLSLFTYMFIHLWPSHLAVDCLLLLVFGWAVERHIGATKTLAIYIVSGMAGGAAHLLFLPTVKLVGSSGAVFGLVGASLVLAPVASIIAFLLLAYGVSPLLISGIEGYSANAAADIRAETTNLSRDLSNLSASEVALKDELSRGENTLASLSGNVSGVELELRLLEQRRGEIGEAAYSTELARLSAEKADLDRQLASAESELAAKSGELENVSVERQSSSELLNKGEKKLSDYSFFRALREVTSESEEVHLVGMFTGYLLLIALEPSVLLRRRSLMEIIGR